MGGRNHSGLKENIFEPPLKIVRSVERMFCEQIVFELGCDGIAISEGALAFDFFFSLLLFEIAKVFAVS